MAKPPIKVVKDAANPEPIELLAKSIVEISDGFAKLNAASLNRRAIVTLLMDMIPSGQITRSQINLFSTICRD